MSRERTLLRRAAAVEPLSAMRQPLTAKPSTWALGVQIPVPLLLRTSTPLRTKVPPLTVSPLHWPAGQVARVAPALKMVPPAMDSCGLDAASVQMLSRSEDAAQQPAMETYESS